MSKRTRNLVILGLIAIIAIVLLVIGITGLRYGINVMVPLRSQIKRGMDYGIGRTTIYEFEDEALRNEVNQERALAVLENRLNILDLSGVRLYAQGTDKIRIDIPRKQHFFSTSETSLQEEVLVFTATQGFFYLRDADGEDIFRSNNIKAAETVPMGLNAETGQPIYGVMLTLDEAGAEALAKLTENASAENVVTVTFGYDEEDVVALNVAEPLLDGQVIIQNNFENESAMRLTSMIQSGTIPGALSQVEHYDGDPMQGSGVFYRLTNGIALALLAIMAAWIVLYKSSGLMASLSMLIVTYLFMLGYATMEQVLITPAGLAGAIAALLVALGFHVNLLENLNKDLYADQDVGLSVRSALRRGIAPVIDTMVPVLIAGLVGLFFGGEMMEDFAITLLVGVSFALVGYFLCGGLLMLMAGVDGKQGHYKRMGSALDASVRARKTA